METLTCTSLDESRETGHQYPHASHSGSNPSCRIIVVCLLCLAFFACAGIEPGNRYDIQESSDDRSHWLFEPAFEELGLALTSSPGTTVGDIAIIRITVPENVDVSAGLRSAAGDFLNGAVTTRHVKGGRRIYVSFPEEGDYRFELSAQETSSSARLPEVAHADFTSVIRSKTDLLWRAVRFENVVKVKEALRKGADPNAEMRAVGSAFSFNADEDINAPPIFTVLSWGEFSGWFGGAGKQKQIEEDKATALKLLEKHGADFRALTSSGDTILQVFLQNRHIGTEETRMSLLMTLLDLGADPAQKTSLTWTRDGEQVKEDVGLLVKLPSHDENTSQEFAAYVPVLIERGADPYVHWPNSQISVFAGLFGDLDKGSTPLIQAFLTSGYDPTRLDLERIIDIFGLGGASEYEAVLSRTFAASSHLNAQNRYGDTTLHLVAENYWSEPDPPVLLTRLLVENGADLSISNNFGETPLLAATSSANHPVIRELLRLGVDPRQTGSGGKSVLHTVQLLPEDEAEKLIDFYLDLGVPIDQPDKWGRTPLNAFAIFNSQELMEMMIARGADPAIPNADGLTAAGAVRYQNHPFQPKLAEYAKSLNIPEVIGGWPIDNAAPACRAVIEGDMAALRSIPVEDFGAMTARTKEGVPATPLHLAAEIGNTSVIAALNARRVNWNVRDRFDRNPLEIAVISGNSGVVSALLDGGADPDGVNRLGETPLTRAIAAASPLVTRLLRQSRKPALEALAHAVGVAATVEEAHIYMPDGGWTSLDLEAFAALGRDDILKTLDDSIRHEWKSREVLIDEAEEKRELLLSWVEKANDPLEVRRLPEANRHQLGNYKHTLEGWSPWVEGDPKLSLADFPVSIRIPDGYDGSEPYGLVISMMNAKSKNHFPRSEYHETLDRRRLLYAGFDPYYRLSTDINTNSRKDYDEHYILAIAYYMMSAYNVDRSRIYLTGYSTGGWLTGEVIHNWPNLFAGGIAVDGYALGDWQIIPGYIKSRKTVPTVWVSGDWDWNLFSAHACYSSNLAYGYRSYFIQEPQRGHARVLGENYEKAFSLLEEGAGRGTW